MTHISFQIQRKHNILKIKNTVCTNNFETGKISEGIRRENGGGGGATGTNLNYDNMIGPLCLTLYHIILIIDPH